MSAKLPPWQEEPTAKLPEPSRHGQYYDARQYTKPRRRVTGQPQRYGPRRLNWSVPVAGKAE